MFSISNPSLVYEASSLIANIALRLNPVEIVTPLNVQTEKERWINAANNGVFRNPVFIYNKAHLRTIATLERQLLTASSQLRNAVKAEDLIDTALLELIKSRIDDAYTSIHLAKAILYENDIRSAECTAGKYGRPNADQVKLAYILATTPQKLGDYKSRFAKEDRKRLSELSFDAIGIRKHFINALQYYGIDGWDVIIDEHATAIDVRNKTSEGTPRVVIPIDRVVTGFKLIELIGHEIECHLRDSENVNQLFHNLLGDSSPLAPLIPLLAKSDDEILYEGHAKLSDASISGNKALPKPYYTIAQDLATHATPFSSVANYIYELHLNHGDSDSAAIRGAWLATYRAFRGCTDTRNPEGYTFGKDYTYLAGFCLAKNLQQQHWLDFASLSLNDLGQLHAAGISLGQPKYPYCDAATSIAYQLLDSVQQ